MLTRILALLSVVSVSSLSTSSTETPKWQPKVSNLQDRRKLRGQTHDTEHIGSLGFHHVEFYCGDAKSTAQRFSLALGMPIVGTTGQHTGNDQCVSYGLQSGNLQFLLTAPYSQAMAGRATTTPDMVLDAPDPLPHFVPSEAHAFFAKHGLAARAVGLLVKDAAKAFDASVVNGAVPVLEPTLVEACPAQAGGVPCTMAEVELYGDVVLRYVSYESKPDPKLPFLPHLAPVASRRTTYGLQRIDHAVGNVPNLQQALERVATFTGFHEFAEFTPEDVGTVESGLNSVVLASDSESVLLPLNEPVSGR